jgi:hypothetical protein
MSTENNKLIAEFMGIEEAYNPNGNDWVLKTTTPDTYGDTDILESCKCNELQYHSSWDWLMPVVRNVLMTIELDSLYYDTEELRYNTLDCDINGAYKEVVEFIKNTEYKSCDRCCYDIVDDDGDIMEHICINNNFYSKPINK